MKILFKIVYYLIDKTFNQEKILRVFRGIPSAVKAKSTEEPVVAATEVKFKTYKNLREYILDINSYFYKASKEKADIICFPELFGLLGLSILPFVKPALALADKKNKSSNKNVGGNKNIEELKGEKNQLEVPEQMHEILNLLKERFLLIMKLFAEKYGMYVSCGTSFVSENHKIYNRHFFLNDKGQVIGLHDKIHLTEEEIKIGIANKDNSTVIDTPFGKIALLVCMDATYFESFKAAKMQGADFAIVPIANLEVYNYYLALRGAQLRVDETNLAAVKSALVAEAGYILPFSGKAGFFYPKCSNLENKESEFYDKAAVIIDRIKILTLRKCKSDYFCLENKEFDSNYLSYLCNEVEDGISE